MTLTFEDLREPFSEYENYIGLYDVNEENITLLNSSDVYYAARFLSERLELLKSFGIHDNQTTYGKSRGY